jgi:two-component system sensor histidine kinase YesM
MREERLSQLLSSIESPLRVEGMDFALKNINAQIALSYGSEFGLSIESVYSKGTSVSFLIPWKDSDKDEANG